MSSEGGKPEEAGAAGGDEAKRSPAAGLDAFKPKGGSLRNLRGRTVSGSKEVAPKAGDDDSAGTVPSSPAAAAEDSPRTAREKQPNWQRRSQAPQAGEAPWWADGGGDTGGEAAAGPAPVAEEGEEGEAAAAAAATEEGKRAVSFATSVIDSTVRKLSTTGAASGSGGGAAAAAVDTAKAKRRQSWGVKAMAMVRGQGEDDGESGDEGAAGGAGAVAGDAAAAEEAASGAGEGSGAAEGGAAEGAEGFEDEDSSDDDDDEDDDDGDGDDDEEEEETAKLQRKHTAEMGQMLQEAEALEKRLSQASSDVTRSQASLSIDMTADATVDDPAGAAEPIDYGSLNVRELKNRLNNLGIDHSRCIEKLELVELLVQELQRTPRQTRKASAHYAISPLAKQSGMTDAALLKVIKDGCTQFNIKPSGGIKFLVAHGALADEPHAVAQFLHEHQHALGKKRIGEYLGSLANLKVLQEYATLFDFAGIGLDMALRSFILNFRLPGEAQQIDRILENFAAHFSATNPGIFSSPDTGYVLSFSIIMLNTDLHNPSIKQNKKMTLAQ
jgi:hypothetical protein